MISQKNIIVNFFG